MVCYMNENLFDVTERPNFSGEILICEDNDLNQQVICDHLIRLGIKTVVAHNGKIGVELITERLQNCMKPFDLIFIDIQMPEMDGFEASSRITALGVKTPIVALTADIFSGEADDYKKNGMTDILVKPFTSQELWRCLMKYLPVISYTEIKNESLPEEDEKFLKQINYNFVRNNQDTFSQIKKASDENDFKLAHRLSHTLKSNAGQIGEKKLREIAAQLEEIFSERKIEKPKLKLDELEKELLAVLEKLAPLLAEIEAQKAAKKTLSAGTDSQKVIKILERLEPLLLNRNPDCEDLIDDILLIPGSEELANYIDKFNFNLALDELYRIKKEWE